MSKYPTRAMIANGCKPRRYDTGEISYSYLKRWHHMPEKWWGGKIRRIMWFATMWKQESAFNYHDKKRQDA